MKGLDEFESRVDGKQGKRAQCRECTKRSNRGKVAVPRVWPSVDAFDKETAQVVSAPEVAKADPVDVLRLKRKIAEQADQLKSLVSELDDARRHADMRREILAATSDVTCIMPRETRSGLREGTIQVLASDWHVEEPISADAISGRNRFNLEIAEQRMTRFFEATRWGVDWHRQEYLVRDMILWLGGDLFSNYLHEDQIENNELSPVESIAFLQVHVETGIRHILADQMLANLVVICNDGNHGRLTKKMRSATRVKNSLEWLLYVGLRNAFAGDPRVTFILPTGPMTYFDVYGNTIRYTHGDLTKFGGGVGGITIPIYKAIARWNTVRNARATIMGHYHQLTNLNDLIINGSLCGFNEFALSIGARFEPPMQDLTMFDSKRFKSSTMPLWVSERADDQEAA